MFFGTRNPNVASVFTHNVLIILYFFFYNEKIEKKVKTDAIFGFLVPKNIIYIIIFLLIFEGVKISIFG